MVRDDQELRLNPSGQEGAAQRSFAEPHALSPDVRSKVESQFQKMEQAHDRIRVEELAARLAEHRNS